MLSRAELLFDERLAVLVPDLQAHGESTGDRITFGFLEARDAEACVAYLRARFADLPLGAVGVSMGGAALLMTHDRLHLRAAVIESVYPTIAEAVDNRLAQRVGPLSGILSPLLLLQLWPRLGFRPEELRPIDGIGTLGYPILIISGTADRHTTEAQTRALYATAREPKALWLVPGAKHIDLLRYDPEGYREHVLSFLREHLLGEEDPIPSPRAPALPLEASSPPACVRVGTSIRAPRKLHDRRAELSEAARSLSTHGGVLIYDATIDEQGRVRDVQLLKPVDSAAPWPEIERAWRTAITEWRYEPTLVDGQPSRVCMTISVTIDVR